MATRKTNTISSSPREINAWGGIDTNPDSLEHVGNNSINKEERSRSFDNDKANYTPPSPAYFAPKLNDDFSKKVE